MASPTGKAAGGVVAGGADAAGAAATHPKRWALAIHGGAGVINTDNTEWIKSTTAGMEAALDAGIKVLQAG